MNLAQHLEAGGQGPARRQHPHRGTLHQCELCLIPTQAVLLLDVQALPETLRGAARWVCDACRATWARERRPVEPGDEFLDPLEHVEKVHRLAGHDTAHFAPVIAGRLERLRGDLEQRAARHPEHPQRADWERQLARLDARLGPRSKAPEPPLSADTAEAWLDAKVSDPAAREYLRWLTQEVARGRPRG